MFFIGITGPTGVGKTALVDGLAQQLSFPLEVINADTGQLYTSLSIGTAKPDLANVVVPHHQFDVISEPEDYTATQYREAVLALMQSITARGAVPVIVGGSGFYIATLFYPPQEQQTKGYDFSGKTTQELWDLLATIDTKRASQIHQHDRYRIERALKAWYDTGKAPSSLEPVFDPPGKGVLYFVNRSKEELHERINARVVQMLEQGWLDEVAGLSQEWQEYLLKKKLIGYPDIIKYLREQELGVLPDDAYELLVARISQRTRGYAKRQITFWKSLRRRLEKSDPEGKYLKIEEINLTEVADELYIKKLCEELENLYLSKKNE